MEATMEMRLAALRVAATEHVTVTVTNQSAANGTYLTPVFAALHDGGFDLFNVGEAASAALERIAEDGAVAPLLADFAAVTGGTGVAGVAGSGPIAPEAEVSVALEIADASAQRFFTYASMVVPSNDAFIGNGNPEMFALFDEQGRYTGPVEFTVTGSRVWDAGTEVNNETEAAFINQTGPDRGDTEGGVVALHPGFNGSEGNPDGEPVTILSGSAVNALGGPIDPVAADFSRDGGSSAVASFSVSLDEVGLAGSQALTGDDADDVFQGGADDDDLVGGAGDDELFGETGDDGLDGGAGHDLLVGGFGDDYLDGGADNDDLAGGEGHDWLVGGSGNDLLLGGFGNDLFIFDNAGATGRDTIADLGAGDVLLFTRQLFDSNGDGIIGFGRDSRLDVHEPSGSEIAIRDEDGNRVRSVEFDGEVVIDGQTYFAYSLIGSAGEIPA